MLLHNYKEKFNSRNNAQQLNETDFSLLTSHFSRKRAAFTLAEVLITLGIIGVVAAITMPTLINKIQDRQNIAKWKKAYSVIYNAFNEAKSEGVNVCATSRNNVCTNGSPVHDIAHNLYNPEFIRVFLSKMRVVKTCGSGSYKISDYTCKSCVDGWVWYTSNDYTSLGGKYTFKRECGKEIKVAADGYTLLGYNMGVQHVLLEDGMVMHLGGSYNGPWIIVDVNGWQNGPNMVGKDLFGVQVFEDKLIPSGAIGSTGYNDPSFGASGCSKDIGTASSLSFAQVAGAGCSAYYLLGK